MKISVTYNNTRGGSEGGNGSGRGVSGSVGNDVHCHQLELSDARHCRTATDRHRHTTTSAV